MPRDPRPATRLPDIPSNSLVASAVRFEANQIDRVYWGGIKGWQQECYRHFRICGEARFAARFMGNAMSRMRLGVGMPDQEGKIGPAGPKARALLERLFSSEAGQSQMLAAVGVHLTIAGECWLVGRAVVDDINGKKNDVWEIVSVNEMNVSVGANGEQVWAIDYGDGQAAVPLKSGKDVVIRIWLPDPARRIDPDSPFRSLLPVLNEIEWATKHLFAQMRSRLATAGIFAIPSETTFPTPPPKPRSEDDTEEEGQAQGTTSELDRFMAWLAESMMATLKDQGNPAALVPIFMKMPGDYIDKMRLIEFWGKIDEKAMEVRSGAIGRFFDGFDLPREQLAGMSSNPGTGGGRSNGVSHWGSWQIEEQTIKMHVEPMAEVLTNALTLSFLRPLTNTLEVFTYDSSALRIRPDRSESSLELNDRFLLKSQRVLEENGFGKEDMMDDAELKRRLLIKIATGSNTPDQVAAANALLGIDLPLPAAVPSGNQTREAPSTPSLEDHPSRPRTPAEAGLVPVSEALVLRTLERAGNRIRQAQNVRPPGVAAFAMHTVFPPNGSADQLLDGAWNTAPVVLDGVVDDVERMVATLDSYCRMLFATQTEHSRARLASFLEASC